MSSPEPPEPLLTGAPARWRPIAWQVAASIVVHSAVLLLLVWPALKGPLEAAPPPVIDVELVLPSSEPSSAESSSAEPSEEGSSEESSATEPSSMAAASSQEPTSEAQSAEVSSSELSAPVQPSAAASSAEEPPSGARAQDNPQPVAPVPMSRPVVIAIGTTGDVATDSSSVEPDGAGELTADTGDASAGDAAAPALGGDSNGQASELGELHAAQTFYLAQILSSAAMANARAALDGLPHDKRLSQTCNIEAIGQVANTGEGFKPDAVIIDAFSKSTISGTRLTAAGAIFRSEQKWYALAFDCTLNDDLSEVTAFTFRLGPDVTSVVTGSGSQ